MLTLGIETIVVLLLIVGIVSAFGGYVVARERLRRAGGGKSGAELKAELGEYKENVDEHFRTTAGLLHDMTEQYRAVYEHMAAGAQNLCDPETAQSQIESLRAGLLPSASADTVESDSVDGVGDETDEEAGVDPKESHGDAETVATADAPEQVDEAAIDEKSSGEAPAAPATGDATGEQTEGIPEAELTDAATAADEHTGAPRQG